MYTTVSLPAEAHAHLPLHCFTHTLYTQAQTAAWLPASFALPASDAKHSSSACEAQTRTLRADMHHALLTSSPAARAPGCQSCGHIRHALRCELLIAHALDTPDHRHHIHAVPVRQGLQEANMQEAHA